MKKNEDVIKKEDVVKKQIFTALVNILIGGCLILSSMYARGTGMKDFIAGVMAGAGCGCVLVGVYVVFRTFRR